jgi:hypothetical protein
MVEKINDNAYFILENYSGPLIMPYDATISNQTIFPGYSKQIIADDSFPGDMIKED